ncbi:MAG: recombinase family protein [Candidatus Hydrogenedentales bacterium]|jgi:DNA invertase Pin-like site-specific DNA recombinase
MIRCVIYSRFSPRPDADTSESCETQEELCRKVAVAKGYDVVGAYSDKALSGGDESRPGLFQAIGALHRGDVLLVYKRDRLARDTYLAESIRRSVKLKGATIEALRGEVEGDENDPMIQAIRKILDVIDELARKVTAQRTSDAMRRHQSQGLRMSRWAPYGWKLVPEHPDKMIENEAEQEAIVDIVAMAKTGMSLCGIAKQLNADGFHKPRAKGGWNVRTLGKIVRRGAKAGVE